MFFQYRLRVSRASTFLYWLLLQLVEATSCRKLASKLRDGNPNPSPRLDPWHKQYHIWWSRDTNNTIYSSHVTQTIPYMVVTCKLRDGNTNFSGSFMYGVWTTRKALHDKTNQEKAPLFLRFMPIFAVKTSSATWQPIEFPATSKQKYSTHLYYIYFLYILFKFQFCKRHYKICPAGKRCSGDYISAYVYDLACIEISSFSVPRLVGPTSSLFDWPSRHSCAILANIKNFGEFYSSERLHDYVVSGTGEIGASMRRTNK